MRSKKVLSLPSLVPALACAFLAACGPAKAPERALGILYVEHAPEGAYLLVDESRLDLVARKAGGPIGFSLAEGPRHVSILAEGYFPRDEVVQIKAGKPVHLDAALLKLPE
ncbi:MAG: hypothetical protein U0174_17480 [Polyangiaceae bacterium]